MYRHLCLILVATLAGAREPPQYTCTGAVYPKAKCDARFVDPFTPVWTTFLGDRRADYEKGSTVYLTLPDNEYARIEVCITDDNGTHCVDFFGGWFDKKARFRQ